MQRVKLKKRVVNGINGNGNGTRNGHRFNGRSSYLVQELQEDFIEEFAEGATDADACAIIGISESTFRLWLNKGRLYAEALEKDDDPNGKDEKHYAFLVAVQRAKARYRAKMRRAVNNAVMNRSPDTKGGWLGLEVLSRRDSANWGREQVARRDTGDFSPDDSFL